MIVCPVNNPNDELGRLAIVLNALLNRLESSFEQQRRFMADASHELRTPLAIVRGESEVALSKDTRTVEEYQESLRIVNDESRCLTEIVEGLFTLARADAGELKANVREVYLDELVA
jgi:signal transduction histidine kinase